MKRNILIITGLSLSLFYPAIADKKNNTNSKTTEKWYLWNSARNEWYLEYINTNRYNENKQRISGTHFNVLNNKFVSKDTILYENDRVDKTIDYVFDNQKKEFLPESMVEALYNEYGMPVGNLLHEWENGTWKPSNGARFVYYTNSGLNMNSQIFETYNKSTNQWEKVSKITSQYFADGNLKIWSDSVYDKELQVFLPKSRIEHEGWVGPNHPSKAVDQRYVNGAWQNYNEITSSISGENYIKIIDDLNNENFDIKSVTALDGNRYESFFLLNNEWKIMREFIKNELNTIDYYYHYGDDRSLYSIDKTEKRFDENGNLISNELYTKFPANASNWLLGEGTITDMVYDTTGQTVSMTVRTYDFDNKNYVNNYKVEYLYEPDTLKQKPQFVLMDIPTVVTLSGDDLEININYNTNSTGDIAWFIESFDGDIATLLPNLRIKIKSVGTLTLGGYTLENQYFAKSDTAFAVINVVKQTTTSTQNVEQGEVDMYPNPANNMIYINASNTTNMIVNIKDNKGNKVLHDIRGNMFNISDLANGIYFVEIQTQNGKVVKRLIKL